MSKKKIIAFIGRIIVFISSLIVTMFSYYLLKLNILPNKYLILFFVMASMIYIILYLFLLLKKIKIVFKVFSIFILLILSVSFVFATLYINKTIFFINEINTTLSQKREYYVCAISSSDVSSIEKLNNKKIGAYVLNASSSSNEATKELKNTLDFELKKYEDVTEMFEDLKDKKILAVLIDDAILSIFESEFEYLNIELKKIGSVFVSMGSIDMPKVKNITSEPFNIYLTGGDSYGSINKVTNTDVNIVMSVDLKKNKILITSIPRDYYVNLVGVNSTNAMDKLTHSGYYGIETSIKTIEKLLDTEINYYIKINFSTAKDLVDIIDGISVYSDYAFSETAYNKYKYTKGINYLNGEAALGFVRERKSLDGGDLARQANQQKVLTAIIKKMTSSSVLISKYFSILGSLSQSFQTNLDNKSISTIVRLQLENMYNWEINTQTLKGNDLYTYTYSFPKMKLYVMDPNEKIVNSVKNNIKEFMK